MKLKIAIYCLIIGFFLLNIPFYNMQAEAKNKSKGFSVEMELNINRIGMDYSNFDLPEPDPVLCRDACARDPKCKACTYVKPGYQKKGVARCWLKHSVPSSSRDNCCYSWVKGSGSPVVSPEQSGIQVESHRAIFENPMWGGERLDACKNWAKECGEPAANEFCKKKGYSKASKWAKSGVLKKTKIITTGKVCESYVNWGPCGGFTFIECESGIFKEKEYKKSQPRPGEPTITTRSYVDKIKISSHEIRSIVNWGLKHNRSPRDIQRDVNSRNETLGGSGNVQLPEPLFVVETAHGRVTMTKSEAEKYKTANSVLTKIENIKAELNQLESEYSKWIKKQHNFIQRMIGGPFDLMSQAIERERQVRPYGLIDEKYGRPEPKYLMGIMSPKSHEADVRWQASENGSKAAKEKARVNRNFHKSMKNFLKEGIKEKGILRADDPGVTVANKSIIKINEMMQQQESLLRKLRDLHRKYNVPELRNYKKELEKRAQR